MAAEAATVTNLSLDWPKPLKSKAAPPHGVHYKYPLLAFKMKEQELVVIHLQRQRIPFGAVEKKQLGNAEEGKLVPLSVPAVCLPASTVKFQPGIASSQHCQSRPGLRRANPSGPTSNWSCLMLN